MNLVFHQFKKDVRQFRIFLGLWLGLLLIDFAVNLGWIGQAVYTQERGFDVAANTWTSILPGILWALVGVLPSFVVLADSPARRDGFLATRPLPKRDWLLAKLLFVLALIVAPWVLTELGHLTLRGMPPWVWLRGTLERLLFALPVAVGCGAFASLWPNVARWARAIAGGLVGYAVISLVFALANYFLHLDFLKHVSSKAPAIVYGYVLMLGAMAFAIWHARAQRSAWARWGGLLATLAVSQWLASRWPWDSLTPRPENQAAATALMARAGFQIPSRAITLQREQDPTGDEVAKFNLGVTPRLTNLPPDCVVEWSGKNARLFRASGGELRGDGKQVHAQLFERSRWYFQYSDEELKSWACPFPDDVLFRQGNNNNVMNTPFGRLHLSKFNLPASRGEMNEPFTLSAELEARVFQWRVIAELPLTPGARTNSEFAAFKFISATSVERRQFGEIFFVRRQIELTTAGDLRCSAAFGGPLPRTAYMIYDPQTHTAWLPDTYSVVNYPRATHTALPEYYTYLGFTNRKPFSAEEHARCRLVVFEENWLGSVPENFKSSAFTLDDKLPEQGGNEVVGNVPGSAEPRARSEITRRMQALKVPAPDAPRGEVSLYLLEFFQLVGAKGRRPEIGDPDVAAVAKYVPHHLELLLNGLPAMNWVSRQLVLNALKLGATEAQKPDLIAALRRQPELAEVLLARDWVVDARPEIYQLLQTDRLLPLAAMRAVAWFHDPETYPRLIAEFEAHPSEAEEELLHNLGLDAELEPIIARNWRRIKFTIAPNTLYQVAFRLAMRHGDPSTLERVYRMMFADEESERWKRELFAANTLATFIQMPEIKSSERQNRDLVLAWLRKHRPEDFVFNPVRRQFVLKENMSTNATAAVSTGGGR